MAVTQDQINAALAEVERLKGEVAFWLEQTQKQQNDMSASMAGAVHKSFTVQLQDAQNNYSNLQNQFADQNPVQEQDPNKEYEEDGSTVVIPEEKDPPLIDPDQEQPTIIDPETGETIPDTDPSLGTDPITGAPVDSGPVDDQGGTLPPNFNPAYGSKDWLGHVMTPTEGLLPQQLERSGPIRRITPVSQLFNNPLHAIQDNRKGIPETPIAKALREGNANSISGGNYYG